MTTIPGASNAFIKTLAKELGLPTDKCGDMELLSPSDGVMMVRVLVLVDQKSLVAACRAVIDEGLFATGQKL